MSFAPLQNRNDAPTAAAKNMGLSLGGAHDAHEREADRVAKHVAHGGHVEGMSMSRVDMGRHAPDPARRRSDPSTGVPELHVQRKPDPAAQVQKVQQPNHVQRPGGGQALDPDIRRTMEMRFHVNLERVRIHTGEAAADKARALHAAAYTVGTDIYFAENRYSPNSIEGRELLAHELTHVVQQSPSLAERPGGLHEAPVSIQRSALEWLGDHIPHPIEKLENMVRKIPGYNLAVMILGKDPFDDTPAPTGAKAWIAAFIGLLPGGDDLYARLDQSGAIDAAYSWVRKQLDSLGLSVDGIYKALKDAYNIFVDTLPHVEDAAELAYDLLYPEFYKGVIFVKRVADKLISIAFEVVMNAVGGSEILEVLRSAADTFMTIVKHPIDFLKHLIDGVWQGFKQFGSNILTHLKEGAMQWLFGSVPNIKPRSPFNLAEILRLVLEITGLSWHHIREKLVKLFGSDEAVTFLENSFDFIIKISKAKSMAAAWEMVLDEAKGLIDVVIDSVKQFVLTKIVTAGVEALVKLFSPVGALIEAIQMIYHFIKFILDKKDQIVQFVKSVINSIRAIASGDIGAAANKVEDALANGIAPALGLLAEQVGLGDIGSKIREIVQKVQKTISDAIDRVLGKVAEKARIFYAKSKAAAAKVVSWFTMRKELLIGEEEHAIYMEGTEDDPRVMIASDPKRWSDYLDEKHKIDKHANTKKAADHARELEKPMPKNLTDDQKKAFIERKGKLFNELADLIVGLGFTKDSDAPPEIRYSAGNMTEDGGAKEMTALRLRKMDHIAGTGVDDEPPIYKNLPKYTRDGKRKYVQGHLLNRKLGGEGKRYNLTPLTYSANKRHFDTVEGDLQEAIHTKGAVMSYEVKVVYGTHAKVQNRIDEINKQATPATPATAKQQTELKGLQAESKLATRLDLTTSMMTHDAGKGWIKGSEKSQQVEQEIEP